MLNLFLNPFVQFIFVVFIASITCLIIYKGFALAEKKGINVQKELQIADNVLSTASPVIDAADKALNNPWVHIVKFIKDQAIDATHEAEQMYIASKLNKDDRNKQAKDTTYKILKLANIEITPEIETVINTAIEKECLAMGHSDDTAKIVQDQLQQVNTQLQQQINNQTQQIQEQQNTIATLSQKLDTVKVAAQ